MNQNLKFIICKVCNKSALRRGWRQFYCIPCSELRSKGSVRKSALRQKSDIILRGIEISKSHVRKSITGYRPFASDDGWMVSFKIPFTQAASKNHVWSLASGSGHVFKRAESRQFQNVIVAKIQEGIREHKVFQNKIWIDLFVQKPNHKGDAINVVDVICDGLKVGLGVDDRWFCIRQVDWEISKHDPQIFITVFQNEPFDVQPCSHCGRILRLDKFGKKHSSRLGVARVCRDCRDSKLKILP